ncbi:D-alanyl-D-alanine carboxypeptidase/D-alanyl-D-alanine-endopeptidase [Haloechinothrix sp. YIM 98757]|uniref:D-alanyl-D-alanine carboxypeptidase/D-alanyl-D-alanine-endopeptidase n=1 Tax=Haloechinothrix aidingensis TaxID=2752311 RepID=A0A838AF52_9PSEU|nr:D-alanyl-D-alanine carboxypeptidase/D-alanyl-D-alanine-endopeptidase [Haloechinothrix aidingensis]
MAGEDREDGHGWPTVDEDEQPAGDGGYPDGVPPAPGQVLPERIGAPAEEGPTEEHAPPRGRRRKLVLGSVALLVVAALAGALAVPDVSNRLELPWAPNAPLGPAPEPAAVERGLLGSDATAHRPSGAGVTAAIEDAVSDPVLGELTGSVMDPYTGSVLWEQDADRPLTPASATKLLTAAAALLSLDGTTRLSTTVVRGEQPGDVVLVGGGDPTLSRAADGEDTFYPGAPRLDELAGQVLDAAGGDVDTVAVDLSAYTGDTTADGWSSDDVPSTYAAPVVSGMLDGARTELDEDHPMRHENPAGELVTALAERLDAEIAEPSVVDAAPGAEVLGEVRSVPLTDLLRQMLTASDNLLAEAVARQVAISEGTEPSFEGAAEATLDVLERAGFDTSGVELHDGSGLSEHNRIPARLLAELLAVTAGPLDGDRPVAELRPLLDGLPVAGGDGTLLERYAEEPAESARGWVRAKTGTLSEVNTLAGTVVDQEGRVLVFALMSEGSSVREGRVALDEIAATLRECGCE